jgi:dihydrofolate synthase/folylpolyglutamate synthase
MISGRKISKKDFASLFGKIKKELSGNPLPSKLGCVTFFELLTTAAFVYFAGRKMDIAVLEVGLGGRLDATNIVSPAVSVITPISYDHQDKLGSTLEKIAVEKAHIVKKNSFLVSAGQPSKVRGIFKAWAKLKKTKSFFMGEDFQIRNREMTDRGSGFDFFSKDDALRDLFVSLPGRFQLENAACAIQAARILDSRFGFKLDRRAYRLGLRRASWPGRLQIVSKDPLVILDGAHNGASFKALRESLLDLFPGRKMTMIFGISKDKDWRRILNELKLFDFKRLIVTQAKNLRAFPANALFEKTEKQISAAEYAPELKAAIQAAFCGRCPNDLFVITGSFFLVAEAQTLFSATKELAEIR